MAIEFPSDFLEFLSLLSGHQVEYLLIGGYAVGFHGYPRATGDMDIWIACSQETARKMMEVYRDFGIEQGVELGHFLNPRGILRMGTPPNRLEVTTCIDGVEFADCFGRRVQVEVDGVSVNLLSLGDLRVNKAASGRNKDLADLENLPLP
ncbi:nucleotidyltransferase [bacterium]|nr:nucleotidyltransferase [bacterium]